MGSLREDALKAEYSAIVMRCRNDGMRDKISNPAKITTSTQAHRLKNECNWIIQRFKAPPLNDRTARSGQCGSDNSREPSRAPLCLESALGQARPKRQFQRLAYLLRSCRWCPVRWTGLRSPTADIADSKTLTRTPSDMADAARVKVLSDQRLRQFTCGSDADFEIISIHLGEGHAAKTAG
jgi:hypothetical protein